MRSHSALLAASAPQATDSVGGAPAQQSDGGRAATITACLATCCQRTLGTPPHLPPTLLVPPAGYGLRSETQLAGLAPDTNVLRFAKQHLMAKAAFPISASAALTLSAEGGLLLPWGAGARQAPTSISDRFFLGGLGGGALRGFDQKGVGPSEPRRGPGEVSRPAGQKGG